MMEYRDYGYVGGAGFSGTPVESQHYSQVYLATHNDNKRLDYMKRSFISFTFGGRHIEDFNLIASTPGDRLNRSGSAAFDDNVSSYDNLNGQKYWGTHYKTNSIEFTLVTDGIDQKTLDDFLHWFQAGETKELILAEHPNRAILARVSTAPQLQLLPFESTINIKISNETYQTSTTLYKGEIILSLIMDDPFWYAKDNILGIKRNQGNREIYIDQWVDANNQLVSIFTSKDALKILYEDGIPLGSMIQNNMLLGNGSFAKVEENTTSCIWSVAENNIEWSGTPWNSTPLSGQGARIEANNATPPYVYGTIAGPIIDANGNGIDSLPKASENDNPFDLNYGHFFYSGTAPAPTIITFTLTPTIGSDGYISSPYNSKTTKKYNTITIESSNKQELRFTTPNILTSYNKAIEIFTTYVNGQYSWETIREHLRDEVRHIRTREWAIYALESTQDNNATANANKLATLKTRMSNFLKNSNGAIQPMTFMFNSDNGEALGYFKYRLVSSPNNVISTTEEEDVGDMLCSNYIIIRDRNYSTSEGFIVKWTRENPQYSHCIYHDVDGGLSNISISYKNMYL